MGRIDRSCGQDATMERRHIERMLSDVAGYELVKAKKHHKYKSAQDFYDGQSICKQNFLKYYRRHVLSGRSIASLIPNKAGRKFKDALNHAPEIIEKLKDIRKKGYNRYDISYILKKEEVVLSASSIYRLMKKLGINRFNPRIKEDQRRIIKMSCGELGHIDIHYVSQGTVKEMGTKKLYLLGIIDSYSRVCWLDVLDSIKSLNVSLSMLDTLVTIRSRYGI